MHDKSHERAQKYVRIGLLTNEFGEKIMERYRIVDWADRFHLRNDYKLSSFENAVRRYLQRRHPELVSKHEFELASVDLSEAVYVNYYVPHCYGEDQDSVEIFHESEVASARVQRD